MWRHIVAENRGLVVMILHYSKVRSMYALRPMRVARRFLCSRLWASTISDACHESNTIRSLFHKEGNDAFQTSIGSCLHQNIGSPSVFWEHRPKSLKHLQRASKLFGFKTYTGTLLGLAVATSFLATEEGAIQCERNDGFQANQQAPEIADIIIEDSLELDNQYKLVDFIRRYWWPTVFLLTVIVGYPYPMSLLPNSLLLLWTTKPNPASIYLWLEKRRQTSQINQGALDRTKEKLNASATVMHVEVRDYMLFCLAKVTYLTSNATMVGVLGDWWVVYSWSSSRLTALGLSLDSVPNLDNIARDFRSKKEEIEAEFKRVTEDGLKKYKTWCEKM